MLDVLTILLVLFVLTVSAARIVNLGKIDFFNPLVLWHAFLVVLLYSRLLTILLVDLEYRWIGGADGKQVALGIIELVLISVLASASLEFGAHYGSSARKTSNSLITYSVPLSVIALFVGALGFIAYYYLLGGISAVLANLSGTKSVPGGGLILMTASVIWIAPVMVLSNARDTVRSQRLFVSIVLFALALLIAAPYGRATPMAWGVLLFVFALHYCSRGVRLSRLVIFLAAAAVAFIAFKAYRLSISWERTIPSLWEYVWLYRDVMLSAGGEQAISDMSLRLLIWGDVDFPLGSFWERWVLWPIELLPSVLFPFEIESATVGRQMYWWATNRFDIDTGVPIFGFVSAYKTGSLGLVAIVYAFLGYAVARLHGKLASRSAADVVSYLMGVSLLLFFSRIGDFSAALVQVIVLGGFPWIFLRGLNAFFAHSGTKQQTLHAQPT